MKLLYKKVLSQLAINSYFNKNVYLDDGVLLDNLESETILDTLEREEISKEKRVQNQVELLFSTLIVKDDEKYKTFKKSLAKDYDHVVARMNQLEIELGSACTQSSSDIKELLRKNFVEKEGESLDFDDIQTCILTHVRGSKEYQDTLDGVLDESFMLECMHAEFPMAKESLISAVPSSHAKRKKKKKSRRPPLIQQKKMVVANITRNNFTNELPVDNDDETDDSDNADDSCLEAETTCKVKLNETDFARLVEVILEKNVPDWDRNIPKKIKEQKIDSEIFESLNDCDKKELIPIMGERVRLEVEWKKIKEGKSDLLREIIPQETQRRSEHMRRFDFPASERTKYTEGYFAPSPSSRPGNLLQPVRKYVMPETQDSKKASEHIVDEIISFAAGCLNERTNGTFYCGIQEDGTIQGCDIDKDSVDALLTKSIRERFKALQIETALKCIRPVKCIDVIALSQPSGRKYVIEVDVIPSSVITGTQMFYVKDMEKGSYLLYRYRDTSIQSLGFDEIDEFMNESEAILKQRKDVESKKKSRRKEDLNKRLKDFLCCGETEFEASLYPILLLNTLQTNDQEQFSQNELLHKVPWRAIFDFNIKDDEKGFQALLEQDQQKTFITHFVDDFNPRKREEMMIKKTKDNITDSPLPAWVYCNGTGEKPQANDPREWTHEYIESFRKVTEFYSFTIPDKRARIIIPIFEKENNVIMEAIVELLFNFGKQCLILSPSRSIVSICEDELKRRPNVFPPGVSIDDCFLIGLPWNQVNDCIKNIVKTERVSNGIIIPRTHGVPFTMDHKIVNELSDLDIVGSNTCHEFEELTKEEKLAKEKECREKYYGGGSVEWINFYFKEDQVLRREVQTDLDDHVKNALEDYNDNLVVKKVVMYHQPGSGGSTTSKQVLWDLREKYKCCVIKKVTGETCDQIGRLRVMGEERDDGYEIKPVLVLIDDNDDDAITKLADDLEKESEKYECDVFCVLLICFRVSVLPLDRPRDLRYVVLNQKLSKPENNWFKEKYESLLKHHEQKSGCHPKTLLAFNIMKENFNEAAIKQSVKAFVCDDSIEPKQLKMLKYLSFFNAFDLHFQSIPISCFDPIMAPRIQWTRDISPSIRVLTSRCHRQGYGGRIQAIRISNYLLSRSVLDTIIEIETDRIGLRNTIGEVALDIMGSECFREKFYKQEHRILQKILGDIIKKRDREKSSGKLEKFSPLILELLLQEDRDQAIEIVKETYLITSDPLVAQQLSRLHAELGNWDEAHEAIDDAIGQKQLNSYLVHTKGHLFKEQMQTSFSQYNKDDVEFPASKLDDAVVFTERAIECFRKCQELSESQDISLLNPAGYESEILVCVEFIRLIQRCPQLQTYQSIQKSAISNPSYLFLKRLPEIVAVTIDKLERMIHATNRHFIHGHSRSLYTINKAQLDKHKTVLSRYFTGESGRTITNTIQCPREVWSLLSAYRYQNINELVKYVAMQKDENIQKHQMRVFLAIILSIALAHPSNPPLKEEKLMDISRKYYDSLGTVVKNDVVKLESYLYFTVFHWPLLSRKKFKDTISPFSTWSKAVTGWLEYERLNAKKAVRRNDKILFYLANSHEYPNLVKVDPLSMAYEALAKFRGTVNQDGTEISILIDSFQSNQPAKLRIPFYKKITRNVVYNRPIEVVVGIGLHGPRADWLDKPSSFRTRQFRSNEKRVLRTASLETQRTQNVQGQTNRNPTHQMSASADKHGPCRQFQQADNYSKSIGNVSLQPRAAVGRTITHSYGGFQENMQYRQRYEAPFPHPTFGVRPFQDMPDISLPPPASNGNSWNSVPQYRPTYFFANTSVQGAAGWQTVGSGRQIDPQRYGVTIGSERNQRPLSNRETRNVGNSNTINNNKPVKRN